MLQKYTSIAICYLLATSSGIFVSANNNNDRTAELYNNNNANGISSERVNDERGNNERRSFLNLGRRHFDHRALLSNDNKQRQQDASDRSLQVDEEATQLSEAQTAKEEAEQIMLSSSPEAQSAISQTISDIQTNPDLSPSEKEEMLKLLKVEATEVQSQVIEDESHINSSKKKKMEKLNEEINNVEVVKDELDVAIQQVEEEVVKETLLKGTERTSDNSTPTSADKKYPTKAPSTINIAGGGGGAYMTTEEPTYSPSEPEPTMSPSPSSSSSGSSSHSPSPSHDALTTSKSGKSRGKSGKGKSGKSGGTKSHKMDPSSSPTMDSLQPTADDDYYTPSPSDDTPSPSNDTPSPNSPFPTTDSPTPAPNTPRPSDDSTKEPSHSPTGTPSSSPTKEPSVSPSSSPTVRPTVPIGSTFYDGFEEENTDFPNDPWSVSSSLDGNLGLVPDEEGGFERRRLQDVLLERAEDDDEFERELNHWDTYHPSYEGTPSPTTYTYSPDSTWHPTWSPTTPTMFPTEEPSNEPTTKPTARPTRRPPDPPQAFTRRVSLLSPWVNKNLF